MAGNSFGNLFRIMTAGYTHGIEGVTAIIDGCPAGMPLDAAVDIQPQMERRRPGQSRLTTERNEPDHVEIAAGTTLTEGNTAVTDGTPIWLIIANKNARPVDYENMKTLARPSHANLAYHMKFGVFEESGGGRASARLTAATVAAGAIAEKLLRLRHGLEIVAYVKSVGDIVAENYDTNTVTREQVDHWFGKDIVRCPDYEAAQKMIELIHRLKEEGNTVGATIECVVRKMPQGLGEPLYDKLEADLAKAMLMINAAKGFELGSGFEGTTCYGSEHNDRPYRDESKSPVPVSMRTNNSGGIDGGISNGMPLEFRVAFKPVATLLENFEQETVEIGTYENATIGNTKGRHDPCVAPRAVPIVEAHTSLVLIEHSMRQLIVSNYLNP